MATHSSVLAWGILGMGELGRLPSMGSHRVGHDRSDLAVAVGLYLYYYVISAKSEVSPKYSEIIEWFSSFNNNKKTRIPLLQGNIVK